MELSIDHILVITAALLVLGVISSIASSRLGIPALLLFLIIGMLAGSDGLGGIKFDNSWVAQLLGIISLALILFDGGLSTNLPSIRTILWKGLSLATVGVLATTIMVGLFASWLLNISPLYGLLLGAVVSSTDAAAVFSVLRAGNDTLKEHLQALLEFESGTNDPMAVFLTVGLLSIIQNPGTSYWSLLPMFIQQMLLGALFGYLFGKGMVLLINKTKLDYEGLYPVMTMGLVLLTYGLTAMLGGSGFLAVYVAAVIMGNHEFIHKKSLIRFHDGLAWLMQIIMFLTLGLLAYPSRLPQIALPGLLIAGFLILLARPISVFLSLSFSNLSFKEKVLLSWVGLRGAVPIILATFPLVAGLPQAQLFFDIVFFIVLSSVAVQGTTLTMVAKWLKLNDPVVKKPRYPLEFIPTGVTRNDLVEVSVLENSPIIGKQIVELRLPKEVLVVLISRQEEFIIPKGGTTIERGDMMLILAGKHQLDNFCDTLGTCRVPNL